MNHIPNNPFAERLAHAEAVGRVLSDETIAIMALAYEQHQRNRLAAITALHRGISLPDDLKRLIDEG